MKALKQLGVNGVIYDRMDWNNDKLVKESIFMTKERSVLGDGRLNIYSIGTSPSFTFLFVI